MGVVREKREAMTTDQLEHMLVEIATGKEPVTPDTPEMEAMRAKLTQECAEITAKGGEIVIPHEIP